MASLKSKINELKAKGLSEELARELIATYDGDMAEVNAAITAEQNKVVEWNKFWYDKAPQIQALAQEYENLKAQMDAIKSAATGNQPNYQPNPTPVQPSATAQANPDELEQRIYRNFSAVQKDLYKIQQYHLEHYGKLPDIEPIEKLIEDRKLTPWKAYEEWVAPMETERKEKALREKITQELTEKFQNEATRTGVNSYMLSNRSATTGEEVTSPLDEVYREKNAEAAKAAAAAQTANKPADPSDFELMSDFVQSMRNGRQGVAH